MVVAEAIKTTCNALGVEPQWLAIDSTGSGIGMRVAGTNGQGMSISSGSNQGLYITAGNGAGIDTSGANGGAGILSTGNAAGAEPLTPYEVRQLLLKNIETAKAYDRPDDADAYNNGVRMALSLS